MESPTPRELAQSGSLEQLYAQLAPIKVVPGWAKAAPSLWPVRDLAVSDRWDFSLVRMANAQPRD